MVEAYTTRPGKDRVDGANPLCVIWREHATSDNVKITIWSEPTAQKMQQGGRRRAFVEAAADCETVAELRELWKSKAAGPWRNLRSRRGGACSRSTRRTALRLCAAQGGHRRAGAAAPPAPVPVSEPAVEIVSEDEDLLARCRWPRERRRRAAARAMRATRATRTTSRRLRSTRRTSPRRRRRRAEDEPADDDDMEDAEAPELLFREDDVVFARDGRD